MRTKPLSEQGEYTRVTYFGEPGTGKTTDLAYMAHLGRMVVIKSEQGFRTRRLRELGVPIENIEVVLDNSDNDLPDVDFEHLEALFYQLRNALGRGEEFVGLGWDTATEGVQQVLEIKRREYHEKKSMEAAAKREAYNLDPNFTDIEVHGIVGTGFARVFRMFRDLPMHWAIVTQLEHRQPKKGDPSIGPALPPMVQGIIMGQSDYVCKTSVEPYPGDPSKSTWQGDFRPIGIQRAKDRDSVMPYPLIEPTFTRVHGYAMGELTVETDEIQQAWIEAGGEMTKPGERPRRKRLSEKKAS